jgi:putative membrane protein
MHPRIYVPSSYRKGPGMTTEDDDDRLGVPRGRSAAAVLEPLPPAIDAPAELRAGETELGRPPQVPRDLTPVTADDRKKLAAAEQEAAARELAEAEELLATDPAAFRWLGAFASPLAGAFLLASAGLLGLFAFSQSIGVLAGLTSQPDYIRYPGYAALAILTGAVLYSALRLAILYYRLSKNRQITLEGLRELNTRTRLRWLAHAKRTEAKAQLEQYLTGYPLEAERDRRTLAKLGMANALATELDKQRRSLLDPAKFSSTDEWLEEFRTKFQGPLDEVAAARVQYWAKRCGLVTAVAPNALVDSLATLYFGFAMLTDLCRIYQVRAGRTGTLVLLGRVFFNAYLAGEIKTLEDYAGSQVDQLTTPGGPLADVVGAGMLGKLGARAAGGGLNYLLLWRLGRYTCRLLRPVAV